MLTCHKETLRRAIRAGELQAARLGREYRISRADLQAFWTAQGGGDLFTPDQSQSGHEQPGALREKAAEVKKQTAKPRKPAGPEQLTLPT